MSDKAVSNTVLKESWSWSIIKYENEVNEEKPIEYINKN